jgi:hypothetical protein
MYIEYRICNFSTTIGLYDYNSWNTTKKKKIEKCPSIKSPSLWYGNGFFLKIKYYYAFIIKRMQKNTFFEWKFIKKL